MNHAKKKKVAPSKYWVDITKRKHFKEPLFSVEEVIKINDHEVDNFLDRNRRLPEHVHLRRDDSDDYTLIAFIVDRVLAGLNSHDLQELIDKLPVESEDAADDFCNHFDLGNWFYDAMILGEVDIRNVLIDTTEAIRLEEAEAVRE